MPAALALLALGADNLNLDDAVSSQLDFKLRHVLQFAQRFKMRFGIDEKRIGSAKNNPRFQ